MAKKAQNDLKAKQKRQKIIVIVGGVLLVGLVAFQAPAVMKKMNQKPPPLPGNVLPPNGNPPGTTTPSFAAPTLGSSSASGAASGAGSGSSGSGSNPASGKGIASGLAVYEVSPQAQDGQLPDLGRFVTKDPFVQQGGGASTTGSTSGDGTTSTTTTTPTQVPTTPTTTPSLPASSASISVNGGAPETVTVGNDFPAANPLFHLVSATTTSARVAIAGGSYADGRNTVTLKAGKPVTLQNTADGTRYSLVFEPPA